MIPCSLTTISLDIISILLIKTESIPLAGPIISLSIIFGLVIGFLLFPSPDFSKSLLIGFIIIWFGVLIYLKDLISKK